MENAQPRNQAEPSATDSRNRIHAPVFTQREMRALDALWCGPVMREELDHFIGCSNSPHVVSTLRGKGVSIHCQDVPRIDRDGRKCWPGRYSLTNLGREALCTWGWI